MWSLNAVGHFLFGWATLSTLIGCGAVAVAVLLPPAVAAFIPHLRTLAVYTAIAAFSFTAIAGKYYNEGIAVTRAEWNAAVAREADSGAEILEGAERAARTDTPDSMRNDSWNRDNWKDGRRP